MVPADEPTAPEEDLGEPPAHDDEIDSGEGDDEITTSDDDIDTEIDPNDPEEDQEVPGKKKRGRKRKAVIDPDSIRDDLKVDNLIFGVDGYKIPYRATINGVNSDIKYIKYDGTGLPVKIKVANAKFPGFILIDPELARRFRSDYGSYEGSPAEIQIKIQQGVPAPTDNDMVFPTNHDEPIPSHRPDSQSEPDGPTRAFPIKDKEEFRVNALKGRDTPTEDPDDPNTSRKVRAAQARSKLPKTTEDHVIKGSKIIGREGKHLHSKFIKYLEEKKATNPKATDTILCFMAGLRSDHINVALFGPESAFLTGKNDDTEKLDAIGNLDADTAFKAGNKIGTMWNPQNKEEFLNMAYSIFSSKKNLKAFIKSLSLQESFESRVFIESLKKQDVKNLPIAAQVLHYKKLLRN